MKSSFIYLNLSLFPKVKNRNMMDCAFCLGWISILQAGKGPYELNFFHTSLPPPPVPTTQPPSFSLCPSGCLAVLCSSLLLLLSHIQPASLLLCSAHSVPYLSVSFCFSFWSLSSWAYLGGKLLQSGRLLCVAGPVPPHCRCGKPAIYLFRGIKGWIPSQDLCPLRCQQRAMQLHLINPDAHTTGGG